MGWRGGVLSPVQVLCTWWWSTRHGGTSEITCAPAGPTARSTAAGPGRWPWARWGSRSWSPGPTRWPAAWPTWPPRRWAATVVSACRGNIDLILTFPKGGPVDFSFERCIDPYGIGWWVTAIEVKGSNPPCLHFCIEPRPVLMPFSTIWRMTSDNHLLSTINLAIVNP